MVRGVHPENAPVLAIVKKERNRRGKLVRYSKRFYNFASSVLKMALYRNLKKDDAEERGFVALPKGLEDEFFRQLTAESRKATKNKKTGFTHYLWVKDPSQANEGLDTHLQAEAAWARYAGPQRDLMDEQWDALMAARECPPEDVQGDFEDLLMLVQPAAAVEPEAQGKSEDVKKRARNKWSKKQL